MKRILISLLLIIVMLASVSVFADGQSSSINKQPAAANLTTSALPRGSKLDLWVWWKKDSSCYYTKNGTELVNFRVFYQGEPTFAVTKGENWLEVSHNWFRVIKNNGSTKTRDGQFVISDKYGTVLTVNIHQSGKMKLETAEFPNSKRANFSLQIPTSIDGVAVFSNVRGNKEVKRVTKNDFTVKSSELGIDTYVGGQVYTFSFKPVKKLGKKEIYGPVISRDITK